MWLAVFCMSAVVMPSNPIETLVLTESVPTPSPVPVTSWIQNSMQMLGIAYNPFPSPELVVIESDNPDPVVEMQVSRASIQELDFLADLILKEHFVNEDTPSLSRNQVFIINRTHFMCSFLSILLLVAVFAPCFCSSSRSETRSAPNEEPEKMVTI